jgi:hypothetical protein
MRQDDHSINQDPYQEMMDGHRIPPHSLEQEADMSHHAGNFIAIHR